MSSYVKFQTGLKRRYKHVPVLRPGSKRRGASRPELNHVNIPMDDASETPFPLDDGNTAPLGEEGFEISHEGGEFEVFSNVLQELSRIGIKHQRHDTRDRRDCTLKRIAAWAPQMPFLTDAYLRWKKDGSPVSSPGENVPSSDIVCVDLFERKRITLYKTQNSFPNVSLLHSGCLGCAPHNPSICITLRTLEEYQQAHRFNPRMSIQAQVKKICALHNVPFHHYLVTQFSIAYDVYLDIIREVDARVNSALAQSSEHWRLLNSCPACEYKLKDEPQLEFSKLIAIDGNNSLRRVDPSQIKSTSVLPDSRAHRSDIWLLPHEVDRFKYEVKSRPKTQSQKDANEDAIDIEDEEDVNESEEGDVTDGSPEVTVCIERWHAAAPDERKRMWKMFAETGIFIAVCRHGFLLLLCDMIQSGELAKYPLALIDRLIDVYGENIAIGYDIGCAFSQTILKSPMLAPKAQGAKLRMLVPSFHGHAHNRGCQLKWHPMYIPGTGLEDFETCERVFSQSNALASGTRYASHFHRIQAIENYFKFWDEDKYSSLTQFISENYRQALNILHTEEPLLNVYSRAKGFTDATYEKFLEEERQYFATVTQSSLNPLDAQYVSVLQHYENAVSGYEKALYNWNVRGYILNATPPEQHHSMVATLSSNLMRASQSRDAFLLHVQQLEKQMNIAERDRWTTEHPRRVAVINAINHKAYDKALGNLERVVVMRLFELTKLNQSGTAYKIRTQIQKHLKSRSRAIRTAVTQYNKAAAQLVPPRSPVKIEQVLDYAFIGEFDLLRFSKEDVRVQEWTQPANRDAMQRYFRVKSAKEEIIRLNVEIRRIFTSIADETRFLSGRIIGLSRSNPEISCEIGKRWELRKAINRTHLIALAKLRKVDGFTGVLTVGQYFKDFDSVELSEEPQIGNEENHADDPEIDEPGEMSEDEELVQMAYGLETWHSSLE